MSAYLKFVKNRLFGGSEDMPNSMTPQQGFVTEHYDHLPRWWDLRGGLQTELGRDLKPTKQISVFVKRPAVSFDVFDTLVSRDLPTPERIFTRVEERSGISNFADLRKQAAVAAAGLSRYNSRGQIYEVYQELGKMLSLSDDRLDELMKIEFEVELEHLVLLRCNITILEKTPENVEILLVSDMHWSACKIYEMLDRIGFPKLDKVHLFVSNSGKRSGWIWPILSEDYILLSHMGDSRSSDFISAKSSGLVTTPILSTHAHRATDCELILRGINPNANIRVPSMTKATLRSNEEFIRIIRRLAFSNPFIPEESPSEYVLYRNAASFGAPLFVYYLRSIADKLLKNPKINRVLMAYRDCVYLEKLFRIFYLTEDGKYFKLDGRPLDLTLIYISNRLSKRIVGAGGNDAYKEYLFKVLGPDPEKWPEETIFIDPNSHHSAMKRIFKTIFGGTQYLPPGFFLYSSFVLCTSPKVEGYETVTGGVLFLFSFENFLHTLNGSVCNWVSPEDGNLAKFSGPIFMPCEHKDSIIEIYNKVFMEVLPALLGNRFYEGPLPDPRLVGFFLQTLNRNIVTMDGYCMTDIVGHMAGSMFKLIFSTVPRRERLLKAAVDFYERVFSQFANRPLKNPVLILDAMVIGNCTSRAGEIPVEKYMGPRAKVSIINDLDHIPDDATEAKYDVVLAECDRTIEDSVSLSRQLNILLPLTKTYLVLRVDSMESFAEAAVPDSSLLVSWTVPTSRSPETGENESNGVVVVLKKS